MQSENYNEMFSHTHQHGSNKRWTITDMEKDMEKLDPHTLWECKTMQPLQNTVWQFLKSLSVQLAYNLAISLLGVHSREMETYALRKNSHINVRNSVICNSQKVETTQTPTSNWIKEDFWVTQWQILRPVQGARSIPGQGSRFRISQ